MAETATIASYGTGRSPEELRVRQDLAATFRLIAMQGWDDLVFTHVSARIPGADGHFLVNPFDMLFEEITASALVKVDGRGEPVEETASPLNPAGFALHGAIHEARPDIGCIIHLHTDHGVAVSAQKHGLLPMSQQAMTLFERIGYHDYGRMTLAPQDRQRLVDDLGDHPALILRNHGTLCVGVTCADAFLAAYTLERACAIQIKALTGSAAWTRPDPAAVRATAAQGQGLFSGPAGDLVWPALVRKLDRIDPGYRE